MKNLSKALALSGVALAAALSTAGVQAQASERTPLISNTSNSNGWRLLPGQSFNGVAGALDGLARLTFTASNGDTYICSGSLLAGGTHVLTAAHCADDFVGKMTVEFKVTNDVAAVTRTVSAGGAFVHAGWDADAIVSLDNGSDIAVLKLDNKVTEIQGFKLSTTNDLGKDHLMAGFGTTGTGNSAQAPDWLDPAYAHYGYNTFEVSSKNLMATVYEENISSYGEVYISDFDNAETRYNSLQRISSYFGGDWSSSLGLGSNEALIAGGDSGGGDYIWNGSEWLLSGVHSWGWQICQDVGLNCDRRVNNDSSFGDVSGSTAVFSHLGWINSVTAVPEPSSYALLLAGLAVVAGSARRRRRAA